MYVCMVLHIHTLIYIGKQQHRLAVCMCFSMNMWVNIVGKPSNPITHVL